MIKLQGEQLYLATLERNDDRLFSVYLPKNTYGRIRYEHEHIHAPQMIY